jgi:hypothetical protein
LEISGISPAMINLTNSCAHKLFTVSTPNNKWWSYYYLQEIRTYTTAAHPAVISSLIAAVLPFFRLFHCCYLH